MKRDAALVPLSREHTQGLMMTLRIERELPDADADGVRLLYHDLIGFWARGLLPHFRTENECLLARLVRHVEPEDELVRRTQRDHLGLEALVATMRDTDELEERREALRRFGEWLREHIHWEDNVLFSETERLLERVEMAALGEEIAERQPKEQVVAPRGPSTGSRNPTSR
jgi:hemerythrin-like domain-containing protein